MCFIEEALVEQLPRLKSLALSFTKNNEDAEDLVSQTCLHILERKNYFKENKNINGWFSLILRNIFINQYRRQINSPIDKIDFDLSQLKTIITSEEADSNIIYQQLLNNININDIGYKCFISLINGYKYEQIAEMFELPVGTVKSRIHLFKYKLRYIITGKSNKYYKPRKKKTKIPSNI